MKKFFILLGLFVLLSTSVSAADVSKVGDWWGTTTINSDYNTNGATISAYIDDIEVASTIVGQYVSGYYLIHVEGEAGDQISFKVNGVDAATSDWSNGDHELNLEIITSSSSGGDDSGGGSGGGGGGGSSSGSFLSSIIDAFSSDDEPSQSDTGSSSSEEPIEITEEESSSTNFFTSRVINNLTDFAESPTGRVSIGIGVLIVIGLVFVMLKKDAPSKETNVPEDNSEKTLKEDFSKEDGLTKEPEEKSSAE